MSCEYDWKSEKFYSPKVVFPSDNYRFCDGFFYSLMPTRQYCKKHIQDDPDSKPETSEANGEPKNNMSFLAKLYSKE